MPVIYIDVLFGVNLFIDMLLLWCSGKISGIKMNIWRVLLGAFIGALYAVCIFFPSISMLYVFGAKFLVSMLIVAISFKIKGFKDFFKTLGIFYLTTIIFGGSIAGIVYFTTFGSKLNMVMSNGTIYFDLQWKVLFFTSCISVIIILVVVRQLKSYLLKQGLKGRCIIGFNNKIVSMDVLFDTGNTLSDPTTGVPVMVAELSAIRDIIPTYLMPILEKNDIASLGENLDSVWINKIRLIPYSAIGTENGVLIGFKPDYTMLKWLNGKNKQCDCIIAIYPGHMKKASGYSAVINPDMIT